MSSDALPIAPGDFARALESLPAETLHKTAAEIQNSLIHLKSSNDQMLPYAEEGDQDCKEAMFENLVVIGRMNERIRLLREEVERRGLRWADAEVEDAQARPQTNGAHAVTDGTGSNPTAATSRGDQGSTQSGRLSDEELRRRLEEQMATNGVTDGEEDEEGIHL